MSKFTIKMNYKASIIFDVDAENEGDALDKARELAEDADVREFSICNELPAEILSR